MTVDISDRVGVATVLHEDGRLSFGPDVLVEERRVRYVRALALVALDRAACEAAPAEQIAYYMDNGLVVAGDAGRLADPGLRFELTSIPAGGIGRECAKTLGHRHQRRPGRSHSDAEICEVVHGVAHFLLELRGQAPGEPALVYAVEAHPGDKVLFPPDTDHLTINPGPETCVFTDAIVRGVTGDYDGFQAAGGAAYHEVRCEGGTRFEPNRRYRAVPPLRWVAPREFPELHLTAEEPLYRAFVQHGDLWRFLHQPEAFWPAFAALRRDVGA